MANVTSVYVSNQSNQTVGDNALFTTDDDLHPLFKPLAVIRMSFTALIACVTIFSNGLALSAVMITPRLRVKAYALTTSLTVTNLLLSILMIEVVVKDALGVVPCELKEFRLIAKPIRRWIQYAAYVHVSFIAVDRYIAVVHALHYENRVTTMFFGVASALKVLWLYPTFFHFVCAPLVIVIREPRDAEGHSKPHSVDLVDGGCAVFASLSRHHLA